MRQVLRRSSTLPVRRRAAAYAPRSTQPWEQSGRADTRVGMWLRSARSAGLQAVDVREVAAMEVRLARFGSIKVDGLVFEYDVVIDGGKVRKRKKGPSNRTALNSGIPRCRRRRSCRGAGGG